MAKSQHDADGEEVERFEEAFSRRRRLLLGRQILFGRLSELTGFVVDELGGDSNGGPWRVWGAGVVLPLVLLFYAVRIYVSGEVQIPRLPIFAFPGGRPVVGATAMWEALALIAWATLLNVQFFWCYSNRLARFYEPAKMLAALFAAAATGIAIYLYVMQ